MVGPEPSKLMMPVRSRPSAPMASSSGVKRLPVKEMVVGSIPPCQPVSWGCRSAARTPVSKTGNVGAIPAALAILLRWQNSYAPAGKAG